MHCRPRDIIILFTLFMLMNAVLHAQQPTVKASVDRTTILIGEPIKLNLEANIPPGTAFNWFRTDTIAHFEIVDPGRMDSSENVSSKLYRQQLIITSFDSGSWTIPAFILQSGRKRFRTDTISINVTFSPSDTAKDYNDIKDILEVKDPRNPYLPWIIAGAALLLIVIIVYFIMKRRPEKPRAEPVSKLTPFEEAMQSLEEVRKLQLREKGEVKLYYTRLNDILRLYISRKFRFSSLEKTNEELILQLRQMRLGDQDYTLLAQALRMADFVKFAKYTPSAGDQEETFSIFKNSITRLEASGPAA